MIKEIKTDIELKKNLQSLVDNIQSVMKNVQNVVIVAHTNPDGDAMGSSLSLCLYLRNKGFVANVVLPNAPSSSLHWMPLHDEIIKFSNKRTQAIDLIKQADIIFLVDFNRLSRVEKLEPYIKSSKAAKVIIDHHPEPDESMDYVISDTSVSSASELVYEYIAMSDDLKLIDKSIAECIFTGIMTDTGCFSFNSSSPRTYQIASELLAKGVNKNEIYSNVYDNYSADRMKLMGYCLSEKMQVFEEYNTAYISLSKAELEEYNFKKGDEEGLVNLPLSIKNIVFAVIFIEKENYVKLSFRSKGSFDTNEIAKKHFNGGGHVNASGGKVELTLDETITKFVELLPEFMNKS